MIEQKVIKTGNKLERATLFLKSSLKESSSIERRLEKFKLAAMAAEAVIALLALVAKAAKLSTYERCLPSLTGPTSA